MRRGPVSELPEQCLERVEKLFLHVVLVLQCLKRYLVHRAFDNQVVNDACPQLTLAVQTLVELDVLFERKTSAVPHAVAAAVLQVEAVRYRARVRQKHRDLAAVPGVLRLRSLVEHAGAFELLQDALGVGLELVGDKQRLSVELVM